MTPDTWTSVRRGWNKDAPFTNPLSGSRTCAAEKVESTPVCSIRRGPCSGVTTCQPMP